MTLGWETPLPWWIAAPLLLVASAVVAVLYALPIIALWWIVRSERRRGVRQ